MFTVYAEGDRQEARDAEVTGESRSDGKVVPRGVGWD